MMQAETFVSMMSEKKDDKLCTETFNKYLNSDLAAYEKQHIKLTHKRSTISEVRLRVDSMYLNAYAFCSYTKQCPVTYHIRVKDDMPVNGKVAINVKIANRHDHAETTRSNKLLGA